MSLQNDHHTLVALHDVLGALVEDGPLSSEELAQQLGLTRFDARLVLVDAHAHGLVRTNHRGQWDITEPGREALTAAGRPPQRPQQAWHARLRPAYLGRRGLPIAVGLIVSAGGVAVANSGLPSFSGPPVIASTHAKARSHARHHRVVSRRRFRTYYAVTGPRRHISRTRLIGTLRQAHRLPRWRPYVPHRLVTLACRPSSVGARVSGRRTRHPAALTLIGQGTATTGIGDRAAPSGRHSVSTSRTARCSG